MRACVACVCRVCPSACVLPRFLVGTYTGLLGEDPGGGCVPKAGTTIEVGHKKEVDLGVLRGADHDGSGLLSPFSTVDGVCVKFEVTL